MDQPREDEGRGASGHPHALPFAASVLLFVTMVALGVALVASYPLFRGAVEDCTYVESHCDDSPSIALLISGGIAVASGLGAAIAMRRRDGR